MPNIKPISDLRNYTEVLRDVAVGAPVFLTKNGRGRYAIVDMQDYERTQATLRLMNELAKMRKVIGREIEGAPHHVWLVLDSTTGQNGLSQAKIFQEVTDVTGIILTKMDGTAKGGIAVAIQSELKVPVKYIGVGESIEDLQKFNSDEFVNALFDVNMDDIGELHLPEEEAGETDAEE